MVGFPAQSVLWELAMPVLGLLPSPRAPVGEVPPSLPGMLPVTGEPGSKTDSLGWLRSRGCRSWHHQHHQLVPATSSPAQSCLQAQRPANCLQQPLCALVARLELPKIIRH